MDAAVLKWHTRRVTAMAFHPLALHVLISGDKSGAMHTLNIDTELGHSVDRNVPPPPPYPSPSTLHPPPSTQCNITSSPHPSLYLHIVPRSHIGGPINAMVFDKGQGGGVLYTAGGDGRVRA